MGDLVRIGSWGSGSWGEFLPSRLIDDDASSAHHTELGVWLQLISMTIDTSVQKGGGAAHNLMYRR